MHKLMALCTIVYAITGLELPESTGQYHTNDICAKLCSCTVDKKLSQFIGDCSSRNLTEIPNNLSSKFTRLDFSHNSLENVPSKIFSQLVHLKVLDLSWNKLRTFSEQAFNGLVHLQELYLFTNWLSFCTDITPYKAGIFSDLNELKVLYINNNTVSYQCGTNWSYPDVALSDLTNLHTLYMDGLTDQIFGPGFQKVRNLTTLSLSGTNRFCVMPDISQNTFANLAPTRLSHLSLEGCGIQTIQPQAFSPLRNIHTIDLSWQHMTFDNLRIGLEGLAHSPIKVLRMVRIHDYGQEFVLPEKTFEPLINTSLTDIILTYNYIAKVEKNFVDYLPPTLQTLDVSRNTFVAGQQVWLNHIAKLTNLRSFNGSFQGIPGNMDGNTLELQVETTSSRLENGKHRVIENLAGNFQPNFLKPFRKTAVSRQNVLKYTPYVFDPPRKLQQLYLQHCHIAGVAPPINFTENNLAYADISGNKLKLWGPWYGLHKLKYLDISNTECDYLTTYFFQDMSGLEVLKIGTNNLSLPLSKDLEGLTFSGLNSLRHLDLSSNYLSQLSQMIFKQQRNLETLTLSNNYFTDWNVTISHMTNLTLLDLRSNRVTSLGSFARSELDTLMRNGKIRLNLLGNQLQCSCDNLEFLKWFKDNRDHFLQADRYTCTLPDGQNTNLANIDKIVHRLDLQCISSAILIVSALSLVGLIMIILAALFCHRHKWQVRFYKNKLALRLKLYEPLIEDDDHTPGATYDAFMSYEENSHRFVIDTVYPILEQQRGFRLCIHSRDFVPGTPIAHNIYRAVHGSGKTVCLLTEAYFQSEWCVYEFNMAYLESVHTGRQLLVPVMMEDIDTNKLPKDIRKILDCLTYLDYRNSTEDQFFDKLAEAIQKRGPDGQI